MTKHILFFIHTIAPGGAERVCANMANHWAGKGWKVDVATFSPRLNDSYEFHPMVNRIQLRKNKRTTTRFKVGGFFGRILALRRLIRESKPDIVMALMTNANIELSLSCIGIGQLIKLGSEHNYQPDSELNTNKSLRAVIFKTLRKVTFSSLDAVTVLTEKSKDWVVENTLAKKVVVIQNAVPWPLSSSEPVVAPPTDKRMILGAGRFVSAKGFDLLISAYAPLAEKYPSWALYIVGDGAERELYEGQIRELGLQDRIFLPGRVGNIADWYAHSEIYVMSSRSEGFGNTLAEAMAYRAASISFDCDAGPREIIDHNVNGLLVPPKDIRGLRKAIESLITDDGLRKELSKNAIDTRERYSLKTVAGRWENLFKELEVSKFGMDD